MRFFRARFFAILVCAFLAPVFVFAQQMTPEQRAALQAQLSQIEGEITQNKQQLDALQQQRSSLERDVAILDSKIQVDQLAIKARNLTIKGLKADVADKQQGIQMLDSKVAAGQDSLAQILRETREIDDMSLAQIALGGSLSDLFQEIDHFEMIQRALDTSFTEMAAARSDLAARKKALEEQQQEEQDLLQLQVLQQNALKSIEKQKKDLVTAARGQESLYLQLIAGKQQNAAQIRSALFGLRDAGAIPFGTAYGYAKEASAATGVRPALILAILTEETNLGENVGSCSWRSAMHPTRDQPVFQSLMSELGLNPDLMKVSCKPSYGWGGAMGPAQFIPSTWKLYQARIARAAGQDPPNPYDGRTATFAAALLLADNGGDSGVRAAERKAALKYFAGSNWAKSAYAFYGDDTMDIADRIQAQIDILQGF